MTRARQRMTAGFLALCLVAAGFVGLSPSLHRLAEHGGKGAAHTHRHGTTLWHDHGDGQRHLDRTSADFVAAVPQTKTAHILQSHPFGRLPLRQMFAWLMERWNPCADSSEADRDHEHRSLAQSLADGLVDQGAVWDFPLPPKISFPPDASFFSGFLPQPDWSAQSASRAPPAFAT
jgi:hypothetical protein